jgi:hypothetical protein
VIIEDLRVGPEGEGKEVLSAKYARANVSVVDLLRRKAVVENLELERPRLRLETDENGDLVILNKHKQLDRIGRSGRQAGEFHWLHALAVDSQGNIYSGEVDTGQRVQKFLRYGPSSCSGTGGSEVGLYSANR